MSNLPLKKRKLVENEALILPLKKRELVENEALILPLKKRKLVENEALKLPPKKRKLIIRPIDPVSLGTKCYNNNNIEQAIYWWTKAAELNCARAMFNLGLLYYTNDTGSLPNSNPKITSELILDNDKEKNYEKAIFWWTKAAELNDSRSMYNLSVYYFNIEKNKEKALLYMHKAADANYIDAIDFLTLTNNIKK
ncbi:MAG: sel1 repeat family protein [Propionibacteriaceae bacterium]|nr:sel1 repeat family protein [Propionibacteriaceae bacterium]